MNHLAVIRAFNGIVAPAAVDRHIFMSGGDIIIAVGADEFFIVILTVELLTVFERQHPIVELEIFLGNVFESD